MQETFHNEQISVKRSHLAELRFYGFAGMSIITFQQIDDYLAEIFSGIIDLSESDGKIIFDAIRSVSRRCDLIANLFTQKYPELQDRWNDIKRRVLRAENNRNSIAHGSPAFGGETVIKYDQTTESLSVERHDEGHFWLAKPGFENWTEEALRLESLSLEQILSDLYLLKQELPTPSA